MCLRDSPFGPVAVLWSGERGIPEVRRVLMSWPGLSAGEAAGRIVPGAGVSTCRRIDDLLDRLEAFLNGGDVAFPLDAFRLDLCSAFQRTVLLADHTIPRGRVSTYGLLAGRVGNPKAARAVGTALATNPFPLVIPCHRVIRSDGSLGGFQGGLRMKRSLLAMEGISFRDGHRVDAERFHYGKPP